MLKASGRQWPLPVNSPSSACTVSWRSVSASASIPAFGVAVLPRQALYCPIAGQGIVGAQPQTPTRSRHRRAGHVQEISASGAPGSHCAGFSHQRGFGLAQAGAKGWAANGAKWRARPRRCADNQGQRQLEAQIPTQARFPLIGAPSSPPCRHTPDSANGCAPARVNSPLPRPTACAPR